MNAGIMYGFVLLISGFVHQEGGNQMIDSLTYFVASIFIEQIRAMKEASYLLPEEDERDEEEPEEDLEELPEEELEPDELDLEELPEE